MKKHYSMLLALTLASLTAAGQNVLVVMKDGTSHKFNADYVSELKFQDFEVTTPAVELSSILVEAYSGGNVTLTFNNADCSLTCVTDLYGSKDASYLQPGTYKVEGSNAPFTVDPAYSSLTLNGDKKSIAGGEVTVALKEGSDTEYDINVNLKLSDGSDFNGKFSGELPTYTKVMKAEMNVAKYNTNPQAPGNFYVKFNDASWKYDIAMVFVADPEATLLPAGEYTFSENEAPGSLSARSYVDTYNPNASLKLIEGSRVSVTEENGEYQMTMNLNFNDGRAAVFTFNGKINDTPTFEQQ